MPTTTTSLRVRLMGELGLVREAAVVWPQATPHGQFDWVWPEQEAAAGTSAAADAALVFVSAAAGRAPAELPADGVHDAALLVVVPDTLALAESGIACLQAGAQDVLTWDEVRSPLLAFRLRAAIERKKRELEARTAYATDLQTGLPHRQQLVEHMSHLLALREREPAPMAVLVLRVEGLAVVAARMGPEAVQVLRRKVAVRLRAGVRASDVVASLGQDSYAILLASVLTPADAQRVGQKLRHALHTPLRVSGQDVPLATALGLAHFPEDGSQPDALLQRAMGLAHSAQAQGRAGMTTVVAQGAQGGGAANDD